MLVGFLTVLVWILFLKDASFDLYEMVPAFLIGLLTTVSVSLMTQPAALGEQGR